MKNNNSQATNHTNTNSPTNLEDALDEVLKQVSEAAVQAIRDYRDHKEPVPRELTHIKAKQAITNLFVSQFLEALPKKKGLPTYFRNSIDQVAQEAFNGGFDEAINTIKDTIGRIGYENSAEVNTN